MRPAPALEKRESIADRLDSLAGRLARLSPCFRDPERFHAERERIAEDLSSLHAEIAREDRRPPVPLAPSTTALRSGYRVERGRVLPVILR